MTRRDFFHRSLLGAGAATAAGFAQAGFSADVFPLGVASGDPKTDGATLWTKVDPEALVNPPDRIVVEYQIGLDPSFPGGGFLSGEISAAAARDYTAKINLRSELLRPFFAYYYRFRVGDDFSAVGRFKTLPAPGQWIPNLRIGFLSCQDYSSGYYAAMQRLAEENVDYIVHLGDYIYETVGDPFFQQGQVRPVGELPSGGSRAVSLEDYRFLYRTYRSDPSLQALHQSAAVIQIWDDHEFQNDSYQEFHPDNNPNPTEPQPELRKAANRAWAEYAPTALNFELTQGPLDFQIYRSFEIGDLVKVVATDERLYRDGPPCGLQRVQRQFNQGCPEREAPDRTMLGIPQRDWFLGQMNDSGSVWNIWANEMLAMPFKLGYGQPTYFSLDHWDGYPAEREIIMNGLLDVQNVAAITGDLHSFMAGHLQTDASNISSPRVGVEFMGGSITSSNFADILASADGDAVTAANAPIAKDQLEAAFPDGLLELVVRLNNPNIEFFNSSRHGYGLLDIRRWSMRCQFKSVASIADPASPAQTFGDFTVLRNSPQIFKV